MPIPFSYLVRDTIGQTSKQNFALQRNNNNDEQLITRIQLAELLKSNLGKTSAKVRLTKILGRKCDLQ